MTDEDIFHSYARLDEKTIRFTMEPTEVTYANCLRRAIDSEVSTLAFRADMTESGTTSDVTILKNTTPMSNEMLADRIGLLPIGIPETSDLNAWDKEDILFRLHVVNKQDQIGVVTADMFECYQKDPIGGGRKRIDNTEFFKKDPKTGDTCLIAVLKPYIEGQPAEEIEVEAWLTPGKGREHARFKPCSQCSYRYTPDTDESKLNTLWLQWLEQKKINSKDLDAHPERKEALKREFNTLERYRSYLTDSRGEPYSFEFVIESLGMMGCEDMVYKGLLSLVALADKYSTVDINDLPDNVELRPASANLKGFDIWFEGEDHTLGNMLQTWILENETGVDFAGYKVDHPLRDEMILRIGVEDTKKFDEDSARRILATAAKGCADMFLKMSVQWSSFALTSGKSIRGAPVSKPVTPWKAHADMKQKQRSV